MLVLDSVQRPWVVLPFLPRLLPSWPWAGRPPLYLLLRGQLARGSTACLAWGRGRWGWLVCPRPLSSTPACASLASLRALECPPLLLRPWPLSSAWRSSRVDARPSSYVRTWLAFGSE